MKTDLNTLEHGQPIVVTDHTFHEEVLQANRPVLVDFWAVGCESCRLLTPIVDAIASEHSERLKVAKCEADCNPRTVRRFEIQRIPTLLLFKHGEVATRIEGVGSMKSILEKITPHLAEPAK